jgi:hypothetical protein
MGLLMSNKPICLICNPSLNDNQSHTLSFECLIIELCNQIKTIDWFKKRCEWYAKEVDQLKADKEALTAKLENIIIKIDEQVKQPNSFGQWRCILCNKWKERSEVVSSGLLAVKCKDGCNWKG